MARRSFVALAFIPSAYGFVAWTFALLLYESRAMAWFPGTPETFLLFVLVSVCFAFSAALHFPVYRTAVEELYADMARPGGKSAYNTSTALLWALHSVGLMGLALYVSDIVSLFGGWGGLVDVLKSETHLVRGADFDLLGIYLSYCGWIAIPLTILKWRIERRVSVLLACILVLQVGGNLLFIDRTRPVWIAFLVIVTLFPLVAKPRLWRLVGPLAGIGVFGLVAFYAIGYWVGKTGEAFPHYGEVRVPTELAGLVYYLTSGFAYFEAIWQEAQEHLLVPERSLYPLFKAMSLVGLVGEPPPQILPALDIPFPANVGTFLEALYSDGGMAFVVPGIVFASFGIDSIALLCLRTRSALVLFMWANLCFVSFISFFVPKVPSTPIWMFAVFAGIAAFFTWMRRTAPREESVPPVLARPRPLAVQGAAAAGGTVPGFEVSIPFLERSIEPDLAWAAPVVETAEGLRIEDKPLIRAFILTGRDHDDPKVRMRVMQFFRAIGSQRISIECSPFDGYARRAADVLGMRRHDVIWVDKEIFPGLPYPVEALALLAGRPVILDYDDDVHARHRGLLAGKIASLMKRADVVLAGNERLAEFARRSGAREVEVFPPALDMARFPLVARPVDAPFTIGWIGTPESSRYLELVRPALERAVKELGARVLLIGASKDALAGLARVERLALTEVGTGTDLAQIDVGISPLDDSASERDRSGYELLQYMAVARAVVASPIGSNATLVEHRGQGILAVSPDEWFAAFKELSESRALRNGMGERGRAKVEAQHTVAIMAPRLAAILRRVARGRPKRP